MSYTINKWYKSKTGFSSLTSTEVEGNQVVEKRIPRFTEYYFKYMQSMRAPFPRLTVMTVEEFRSHWIEECLIVLNKTSFDEFPKSAELRATASSLFESYARHDCLEPEVAIEMSTGGVSENWIKETAKQLRAKSGSDEYEAVSGLVGNTSQEQAEYLHEHYSDQTPSQAVTQFFALAERVKHSRITKGVLINLQVPKFVAERTEIKSVQLVVDTVSYANGIITLKNYADEDKLIYNVLNEWYMLVKDKDLPQGVYTSNGELNGINNVTFLEQQQTLLDVYPHAVSEKSVELHYRN